MALKADKMVAGIKAIREARKTNKQAVVAARQVLRQSCVAALDAAYGTHVSKPKLGEMTDERLDVIVKAMEKTAQRLWLADAEKP